jgi:hypothetical protein
MTDEPGKKYLIWRDFSRSRLHEWQVVIAAEGNDRRIYTKHWNGGHDHHYAYSGSGNGFVHFRYQVDRWIDPARALPEIVQDDWRNPRWMDDLFVCPVCRRWHPYKKPYSVPNELEAFFLKVGLEEQDSFELNTMYSGFVRLSQKVFDALCLLAEARATVPEYQVGMCGKNRCDAALHRDKDYTWHHTHLLLK